MDQVERAGKAQGLQTITLEVRESNTAAVRLYEGCGYHLVGKRPRYYEGTEDALLLSKFL